MPTDTRRLYDSPGRRLSIGAPATKKQNPRGVPGVYQSGTSSNEPGPVQSPTRSLTMVQTTRPGEGVNTDPNRAGSGGTITRGGILTRVAPTPAKVAPARVSYGDFLSQNPNSPAATGSLAKPPMPRSTTPSPAAVQFLKDGIAPPELSDTPAAPVSSPTTRQAPQTEAANPMTGDTNSSPGGTTQSLDPALAMGYSRRGSMIPRGQDAAPGQATRAVGDAIQSTYDNLRGGKKVSSLSRRQFPDRRSASPYSSGVRNLFAGLNV